MSHSRHKSPAKKRSRKRAAEAARSFNSRDAAASGRAAPSPKPKVWIALSIALAALIATGLVLQFLTPQLRDGAAGGMTSDAAAGALAFVGTETCSNCHRAEADLWRISQHAHAMDHATEASVLGNFNDASFDHFGVHSRFFRKDGKYFVETDGPDGKLDTFEVKYTFGVDPLQQYLVEFPDGRLQALSLAWDSRPKDKGGQHWFHLYPNEEIKHDDVLHWTKLNQNWNFMCAECHSTGVHKNYDAERDHFATTWVEINVACEACHGPGSRHVAWAQRQNSWWQLGLSDSPAKGLVVRFDERRNITWTHNPTTGNPQRSLSPGILRKEVETCGLCHARRGQFSEDWIPGQWLSDTHVVSTLSQGFYSADGQMLDEVYNYGSFKQSKMFAAGVTCTDCHDPHSAKLRHSGDNVCLACHLSDKYASVMHSHHEGVSPPLTCTSCHMPKRTYMVIDTRHDHSFRVPRPDLSVKLGTPNACNDCHIDKSAEWAASTINSWYGPNREGFQNYAEAFHSAWTDQLDAAQLLAAIAADTVAPAFARASALSELASYLSASNIDLAKRNLSDPDPMVRIGALDMLQDVPATQLWPLVSPLLSDPSRSVRIKAVSLLAAVPNEGLSASDRARFERVAQEFVDAQRLNADRPEARTTLGGFYAQRGRSADAEAEYKAALRLSPQYSPAAINLADLYRQLGRDGESESTLRDAIAVSPLDAGLHHALGLTLVRLNRHDDALEELLEAVNLAPDQSRYAYVYAVGLHSNGRDEDAITVLKGNFARHPGNRETLSALISFSREAGDFSSALDYAERLAKVEPNNSNLTNLIQELRNQVTKPD
jgi:predicted CXXCH cytochrome family protein